MKPFTFMKSEVTTIGVVLMTSLISINQAIAADDSAGGLPRLIEVAKEWDKKIYLFIGACAAIYLTFQGVQVWLKRATWSDFGEAALKVAVVGGVPAIATFFWNFFKG